MVKKKGIGKKIGEEIQPLHLIDKMISLSIQNAEYHVLFGYTYDSHKRRLVKAKKDDHCVAYIENVLFNGISKDGKPFILTDEEEMEQQKILENIQLLLSQRQKEMPSIKDKLD